MAQSPATLGTHLPGHAQSNARRGRGQSLGELGSADFTGVRSVKPDIMYTQYSLCPSAPGCTDSSSSSLDGCRAHLLRGDSWSSCGGGSGDSPREALPFLYAVGPEAAICLSCCLGSSLQAASSEGFM